MERKPTSTRSRDNRTSADSDDIIWLAEKQYATPAASKQRPTILMHYAHLALTFGEVALGRRVKKAVKTMIMVHIVLETLANLISDAIAAVDQVVQSQGTTLSHAALGIGNRLRQKLVGKEELTLRPDPKPFLLYGMLRECSARCAEIADDIWALLQSRQAMGKRGPILRLFLAKDWKRMRADAFESVEFSFRNCKGKKLDTRRPFDAIRNGAVEGDRLEVCANFWLREREHIMAISGARRQHMVLDTRHVPPQYDIADLKRLNTKEKHLLRARCMATFLAVEYNILRQSEECGASLRWEAARTQVRVEANYQGAEAVREHSENTRELKEGIREISNALRWSRVLILNMFGGKGTNLYTQKVFPLDVLVAVRWESLRNHPWWKTCTHETAFCAMKEAISLGPERLSLMAANMADLAQEAGKKVGKQKAVVDDGMSVVLKRIEEEEENLKRMEQEIDEMNQRLQRLELEECKRLELQQTADDVFDDVALILEKMRITNDGKSERVMLKDASDPHALCEKLQQVAIAQEEAERMEQLEREESLEWKRESIGTAF